MSTKLIIHKFDSDIQIQTLKINIQDDSSVSYSDWSDSFMQPKQEAPKSSKLVVKLVSGNDPHYFDLDNCAKKVENNDVYVNINGLSDNTHHQNKKWNGGGSFYTNNQQFENSMSNTVNNKHIMLNIGDNNTAKNQNRNNYLTAVDQKQNVNTANTYDTENNKHSPLEYSLERVKENNARIMENIHVLNRTINYTKEKEFMDNICTKSMRSFHCNACGKSFVYETGLKRHYSIRHSLGEMQPRWQVVWTCIECFQVWPRQDLAFEHSNLCCKTENDECVKEIKTSLLLQCEFCERVFTSIPRLLKHSKSHTTANNYECNPCKLVFSSYKGAEQHWTMCPFLKLCYLFSLPKMLLCNSCDRKFKNYEHLYNHRYKVSHFAMKIQHNRGNAKTLGMLVYQCELCPQWFTSVPPLHAHRQGSHPRYDNDFQTFSFKDIPYSTQKRFIYKKKVTQKRFVNWHVGVDSKHDNIELTTLGSKFTNNK